MMRVSPAGSLLKAAIVRRGRALRLGATLACLTLLADVSAQDENQPITPVVAPEADASESETESPKADSPAADQSSEEKPAAVSPAPEAPASEKPAAEKPAAEEPAEKAPAAEEPAAETPEAADTPTVESGLSGLLPEDPPADIITTLGTLPETWTAWGEGITQKLSDFYATPPADLAAQREVIAFLKVKLGTVHRALGDYQFGSIRPQLITLRGSLARRIDILEAVLDTDAENPLSSMGPSVDKAKQDLLAATDALDGYLESVQGGVGWKTYLRTPDMRTLASGTDLAKLLAQITPVLSKLEAAAQSGDPAIRAFAASPALTTYHRDLSRTASLLTRAASGTNQNEVRVQLKALLGGLEKYEAASTTAAAVQVRTAYDLLRSLAADGGARLTFALRQHYFNSNVQIAVSESFLNRLLSKSQTEEGGVRDFVLGADVFGSQVTSTNSTFDLLPSERHAVIRINLMGTVDTDTEAYKSNVIIYSNGHNQFFGNKDIHFDGITFSTTPAQIQVSASNQPVGASTKVDRIPLLGKFARNLAMEGAIKMQPQSEAIAAERVSSRVGPEFDSAVDSQFSELNSKLNEKVVVPLKSDKLFPDYQATRTTDTELQLFSRLMADNQLAGDSNPAASLAESEVALRVHESLINNALDRLELAGKMMTDDEFHLFLEGKLSNLRKKPVDLKDPQPATTPDADLHPQAFIFADQDPLRVKVADGKIVMIIRAGFHRDEAKGGDIPPQIVSVPLALRVDGEEIVITRGDVSVDPVEPPANVTAQVARAGVIKSKIESAFQENRHSRKLTLDKESSTPISFSVTDIVALDGWLAFRFR